MFPSSAVGEGDMLAKPVDSLTSFASSCVLSECQRRRTLHELSDQGQAAWEQILQQLEINHLSNWVRTLYCKWLSWNQPPVCCFASCFIVFTACKSS